MTAKWIATVLLLALIAGITACAKPAPKAYEPSAKPAEEPVTATASAIENDINTLEVADDTGSLEELEKDLAALDTMFG